MKKRITKKSQAKASPIFDQVYFTLSPSETHHLGVFIGKKFQQGIKGRSSMLFNSPWLEGQRAGSSTAQTVRRGSTAEKDTPDFTSGACAAVIALYGDLGSGKTIFAKGLAKGLGVPNARREVLSPSFTMVREHQGNVPFYHMDLYRIHMQDELYFLNLENYFSRKGVVLIEWAERAAGILPDRRLDIHFEVLGPKKRRIKILAKS